MILLRPKMYSIKVKGEERGSNGQRALRRGMSHAHFQKAYHQRKIKCQRDHAQVNHTQFTRALLESGLKLLRG